MENFIELNCAMETIKGVFSPKDDNIGVIIKWYIENHSNMKVERSDMSKTFPDIHNTRKDGRFLVLLSRNLIKEHKVLVYITEVLYYLYKNDFVTVTVVNIDPGLEDTEVPVNLRSLPYFTCFPPHTEQDLHPICLQLTGAIRPMKDVMPIGNVGVGLAWSYFYGYLNLILPGITERIHNSKFYKENEGRVFSKFLILLPKSCNTPGSLKDVDTRFASVGPLDDGFKRSRAGQPERLYKNFVNTVQGTDGKDYYFCGEFATPLLAMQKMLQDDMCGMDEQELRKQMAILKHTLMCLLNHKNNPSCKETTVLLEYDDQEPTFSLVDELCKKFESDTFPPTQNCETYSTLIMPNRVTIIVAQQHEEDHDMARSLSQFCRKSMAEEVPVEIKPIADLLRDNGSAEGTTLKVFVILSERSISEIDHYARELIHNKHLFEITTFVLNFPPEVEVPPWLEECGADYIDHRRDNDMWKRINGSLFGVWHGDGEDGQCQKTYVLECSQYQVDRLPVGNVAEGLAWSYYHNYLTLIGPTMRERITQNFVTIAPKCFILVPYSCFSHPTLTEADEKIQQVGKLQTLTIQIAGNNRNYDNTVYAISANGQKYYACVEYCTPVLVMYEMEAEGKAGLSKLQREAQLLFFYDTLKRILQHPSATATKDAFQLVYYDDKSEPLSKILAKEIQDCV